MRARIQSIQFIGLGVGKYIWAVQAIDNAYSGSLFSDWQEFEILPQYTEMQTLAGCLDNFDSWIDYNNDGYLMHRLMEMKIISAVIMCWKKGYLNSIKIIRMEP
jgi:hypothetical protein